MLYSFLFVVHPVSFVYFFFLMIRRPPRSTLDRSSAASDVYKRQVADSSAARAGLVGGERVRSAAIGDDDLQVTESFESVHWVMTRAALQHQALRLEVSGAVSYTHLRAHETVLDLVCRLLLAKKQQNTHK